MYAVSLNNFKITQMLITNPNINLLYQDITGNTAFHYGIIQDVNEDLIKLFGLQIINKLNITDFRICIDLLKENMSFFKETKDTVCIKYEKPYFKVVNEFGINIKFNNLILKLTYAIKSLFLYNNLS
jgi:hypothetical protein